MTKSDFWQDVVGFDPENNLVLKRYNTADRNGLGSVIDGTTILNTDTNQVDFRIGGTWQSNLGNVGHVSKLTDLNALTSRPPLVYVDCATSIDDGIDAVNDGGGGWFVWVPNSALTVNGTTIFSPTGTPLGRYIAAPTIPRRITTSDRDLIAAPPTGLLVYNTTTNHYNYRSNSGWETITSLNSPINVIIGSATVASGTTNGILFNNAGIVGNTNATNNAVVVTNGSGFPSTSTTLPSGIAATNMVLTTPNIGVAAGTSLTLSTTLLVNGITVGRGAGNISTNTAAGAGVLGAVTTGYFNTAVGNLALENLTTGYANNAIGGYALRANTTGVENQAMGYRALYQNTTGFQNTAIGSNSMYANVAGNNNTALGMYALHDNIGVNGVNGYSNVAIGFSALHFNVDGYSNTALGYYAMRNPTTGVENVAIGALAFPNMTTGSNNIGLGFNVGGGITTGSRNTIIGGNVVGLSATLSDSVIIATGNNSIRLFSDSAGLTGIGTVTPLAKLQVTGGDLYVSTGAIGIGTNTLTGYVMRTNKNITGATISYGIYVGGSIQSDVTSQASLFRTHAIVANASFTLPNLIHYNAVQSTIGAAATVSAQYGFYGDDTLAGATNNYQFYAGNAAAVITGKTVYGFFSANNTATGGGTTWGFYANGTAANLFKSDLTIYGATAIPAGGTTGSGYKLSSTVNLGVFFGSGAPTLSAAQGSIYLRSDGIPHYNTNGTTGWTSLAPLVSPSFTTPNIGVATGTSLAATGAITSSGTAGIGYATGAGGTQVQATNKATTVVLNKIAGQITMDAANLATATAVSFTLTNSTIASTDLIVLNHVSAGTFGAYSLAARAGAGSATISVRNVTAGDLAEAIVIGFVVIKAVTA